MSLNAVTPEQALQLLKSGAVLVDIRERDEYLRENIPGARHHALSTFATWPPAGDQPIIFHCRSGQRTRMNADRLETGLASGAYMLEGGLDEWKRAGLPVTGDKKQPIEMMRQVQIAAGSLVLLGTALGAFVNHGFYAVPAFIGAGLTFSGISGTCAMARLLALAPWNRRTAATLV